MTVRDDYTPTYSNWALQRMESIYKEHFPVDWIT